MLVSTFFTEEISKVNDVLFDSSEPSADVRVRMLFSMPEKSPMALNLLEEDLWMIRSEVVAIVCVLEVASTRGSVEVEVVEAVVSELVAVSAKDRDTVKKVTNITNANTTENSFFITYILYQFSNIFTGENSRLSEYTTDCTNGRAS